jgi:hypothetical protein
MFEMHGKKYVFEKELSSYFPFTANWFRKERYLGKDIPYVKCGRKVLYEIDTVKAWFAKNVVVSHNAQEESSSAH